MRTGMIAVVVVAACGLALAGPLDGPGPGPPGYPFITLDPGDPVGGPVDVPPSVSFIDADRDGYVVAIDCNDDDASVNPAALEKADGIDGNCDGVVDDGLDATIDWPRVEGVTLIWPRRATDGLGQHVSTATQPRLIWTGDHFLAVWIDIRDSMRVASVTLDGTLTGTPAVLRPFVSNLDVAWTGTRLGVVYEDGKDPGAPSVRMMYLDRDGSLQADFVLIPVGREPKIAWGQDRFGVVWKTMQEINALRFQRFGLLGQPLSVEEVLENSGSRPAIVFDGTIAKRLQGDSYAVHEGMFGIAYEANYGLCGTGDVLLKAFPRTAERMMPIGPVRVNQHNDPYTALGAMPAIAANESGFLVAWHAKVQGRDRGQLRYFTHDALAPAQEFIPDADAARSGRLAWTGGEFVMINDNRASTEPSANAFDVHFRRIDATGNTHPTSPRGAWSELNLRDHVRGTASVHPDVALAEGALGLLWVERDTAMAGAAGRLWFALVSHK